MTKTPPLRIMLTVLLVLALLLAACGGGIQQETAGEAGGDDSAEAADDAQATVDAGDDATAAEGSDSAEITMIGYGGDLAIPYREFLADPYEEDNPGVSITIIPSESGDFVAQIKAASGASPYDAVPLGESRLVPAIDEGWISEVDEADVPNFESTHEIFRDACRGFGAPVTYSLIGLAYNPERVPAPTAWEDLWSEDYAGEVGLVSSASNLGFAFIVMAAQLAGGSESDLEPGLDRIADLEPFLVADNPTALAQLFERGEIGIAPLWNNDAAVLKEKGLSVEYVRPEPGAIADVTCMTKITETAYPEHAVAIIDRAMSVDYQQPASEAPFYFGPTNSEVEVPADASDYLLTSLEEFDSLVRIDWDTAADQRSDITEQFNQRFGG